jgi:hypothetical protein
MCGQDPFCSSKLGTDPNSVTAAVYQKLESGFCPQVAAAGGSVDKIKESLGFFAGDPNFREAAPSLIYRLNRCSDKDIQALTYFWTTFYLGPFAGIDFNLFSWIVSDGVERSEMWQDPSPTYDDFVAHTAAQLYTRYPPARLVASWLAFPFLAPHDQYYGQIPETSVPILALSGTMDPNLSVALGQRFGSTLTKPHQQWIIVPRSGHITLATSPLKSNPQTTCGLVLATQFLQNPTGTLDTSCLQDYMDIDFHSTAGVAEQLYSTNDVYE